MAKVKEVRTCRKCGTGLLKKDQIICHQCGFRLRADENQRFATPDYLYYQRQDLLKEVRDGDKEAVSALNEEMRSSIRNSDTQDIFAALYDARARLSELVHTQMSLDQFLNYVKMGEKIGALSKSLKEYITNQGSINAISTGIDETETGDSEEN